MENPISLNATASTPPQPYPPGLQFTCLSCLVGFPTGEAQRGHYRSDHHRYNMKRRVAGLPPVTAATFNQKVLNRRAETALTTADRGASCEVCNKVYSTENAYRSHIMSKKHRDNEFKLAQEQAGNGTRTTANGTEVPSAPEASSSIIVPVPLPRTKSPTQEYNRSVTYAVSSKDVIEDDEEELSQTIDDHLAAARSRLGPLSCLFCSVASSLITDNLDHMAKSHGFFIPDAQYLEDLQGLVTYLAEKVAIGNACLFCNHEYRSLHAVQKHMIDKSHTKIAYDSERERLEIADFYDFTASYPDADAAGNARRSRSGRKTLTTASAIADEQWEDEDEGNVTVDDDESVYDVESDDSALSDEGALPDTHLKYGDTPYELVLPSGARIGHRNMVRYYKQKFGAPLPSRHSNPEGVPTGREMVQCILTEKEGVLVPASGGGFGAFGNGTLTIKARNRGEAKEAGRHIREFRDQNRREQFKTAVAFRHNNQKHYRDPLLQ